MKRYFKSIICLLLMSSFLYAGTNSLTLENDAMVGKDNHYTNGLFYVWMSDNDVAFPDILKFIDLKQKNVAFSISHAIFTPKDKDRSTRNLDDLPYAGYLDFNFLFYKSSQNIFNEIGINLGLVGSSTQAGKLQKWFHGIIGDKKPKGWSTQLGNQLIGGISYNMGYKTDSKKIGDFNFDTTVNVRGNYGNFYSGIVTGVTLRLSSVPMQSFSVAGNFIGADETFLLNYREKNSFSWSFSLGTYYNKFYKYYLLDEAIDEGYHLKKIDYMLGGKVSLDLFYKDYKVSFYLKSVNIYWDKTLSFTNEKTGGISIIWKF